MTIRVLMAMLLAWSGARSFGAGLTPAQVEALPPPADRRVDFLKEVRPLFEASCTQCHARGKAKGGFSLESRAALLKGGDTGPALVPGNSGASLLIELVSGFNPDSVMPAKGTRWTRAEIGLVRAWIDQGADWDTSISFAKSPARNLKPRNPELPPATAPGEHPVDRWLHGYFTQHHAVPKPVVEDRVFARRVHLDVTGLLPTPEELQAFLSDPRPDKRAQLVDRLLANQSKYAGHWLSFWNDLLRNDYRGTGYIDGGRKQISQWLLNALHRNLPYDQFVAQLVNPTAESEGFVKGIVWRGAVNSSQTPEMQAAQNIAQVFLGVNLKCASCHDSFINQWTLADAYGMAAVYAEGPLEMYQCDKPTGRKTQARFVYPELGDIPAELTRAERLKRLSDLMTSRENGRVTRTIVNRLWARFLGRGLVEPLDDMEQPAWHPDLLDWLAEDLAAHGYDLKRTMRMMLTSRAYQLPAVNLPETPQGEFVFTGPAVRRVNAEQFRDALGHLTGVWYEKPEVVTEFTADGQPGANQALKASKWIWSDANAAQKAVAETVRFRKTIMLPQAPEEAWAVMSCDNSFTLYVNGQKATAGNNFQQPNYVNLLPHLKAGANVLAVAAINHRPDNSLPREDQPPVEADASPAGLVFFARISRANDVVDVITDSTWRWHKGKVDGWEKPGFDASQWASAVEVGAIDAAPWKLGNKLAHTLAAGVAHGQARASLVPADPLATALGRPNREQVSTVRASVATTLQALELTNGETLSRILARGADNLLATKPNSTGALVESIYRRALGRPPTPAEQQQAAGLLGESAGRDGIEDLLWAVAMLPEFQLIY